MKLEETLNTCQSRIQAEIIAKAVLDNDLLNDLVSILIGNNTLLSGRASWPAEIISSLYPHLFKPYCRLLIESLNNKMHDATKRQILKIINRLKIPKTLQGKLISICYEWMLSSNEPYAVRVNAMSLLYTLSISYPELSDELVLTIELLIGTIAPSFDSRAKKILNQIKK
jgi:hypothetical protein